MNARDQLQKLFHEPARLAIVSTLCAVPKGLRFPDLRRDTDLTDGNLSRHLRTLVEAGVVTVDKSGSGRGSQTTVRLSPAGRRQFLDYLAALESVLEQAVEALPPEDRRQFADLHQWSPSHG